MTIIFTIVFTSNQRKTKSNFSNANDGENEEKQALSLTKESILIAIIFLEGDLAILIKRLNIIILL